MNNHYQSNPNNQNHSHKSYQPERNYMSPQSNHPAQPQSFLQLNCNIRNTHLYKKTRCLSVITDKFVKKYINKFSRTTDQMIQASRSVKQNLIEGAYDGATSKEMELKLFNVARGSLQELLEDYVDFLDFNGYRQWDITSELLFRTRSKIRYEEDPAWYAGLVDSCSDAVCANIIITLIYQIDSMLTGLISKSEKKFLENGGLKETMHKYRLLARSRNNLSTLGNL